MLLTQLILDEKEIQTSKHQAEHNNTNRIIKDYEILILSQHFQIGLYAEYRVLWAKGQYLKQPKETSVPAQKVAFVADLQIFFWYFLL